jgi:hypothetical protein
MKARWKGVGIALFVAAAASTCFVWLFYGVNLDDFMAVHRVTRKGALWVGMLGAGDHRRHLEPLAHFLFGAASFAAALWVVASCLLGPVGWVAGYLWERRRNVKRRDPSA